MTPFRVPASWKWMPSPNHGSRGLHKVTAIVLHADASAKVESSLDWTRKSQSELDALWENTPASKRPPQKYKAVSYHILTGRNGVIYCTVNPDRRAWHAGISSYNGESNWNDFSVGVCLSNRNDGVEPYPMAQQGAAADVCAMLCGFYGIAAERIVTHAMIAPTRKTDPKGLDLDAFRAMVSARLTMLPGAA